MNMLDSSERKALVYLTAMMTVILPITVQIINAAARPRITMFTGIELGLFENSPPSSPELLEDWLSISTAILAALSLLKA